MNNATGQRIKVKILDPELSEEDAPDPRPEMQARAESCWELISRDRHARNIVQHLLDKGCDWVQLLSSVELYCDHTASTAFNKFAAKFWHGMGKKIRKFDSTLMTWEAKIQKINKEIMEEVGVDVMSASAIARIRAAQKARWAKWRKQKAA